MEKHGTARTIPLKLRHSGQVNGKVLLTCDTEAFTHAFPWARPGDDVVVLGLDIKPEGEPTEERP